MSSPALSDEPSALLDQFKIEVPDREHAIRCAGFAGSLFDGLHDTLDLAAADRRLAVIAALLHDAGYLRGNRDHHRKSYDIINAAGIPGISSTERVIAACAARYHGRTMPNIEHAGFGELEAEDQRRVRRLSAIVRLAAAGDASHLGLIESVYVRTDRNRVVVVARASEEPSFDRDRLREAAGGFTALTYLPLHIEIEVIPKRSEHTKG